MLDEAVHPIEASDVVVSSEPLTPSQAAILEDLCQPDEVTSPRKKLLNAYSEWLFYERRLLCMEIYPDHKGADDFVPQNTGASDYHFPSDGKHWNEEPQPSTRAAHVLDIVGCDWINRGRRQPKSAKPDPVFALIASWQAARKEFNDAGDPVERLTKQFATTEWNRPARALIGHRTHLVGPDFEQIPLDQQKEEPVYLTRAEVERFHADTAASVMSRLSGDPAKMAERLAEMEAERANRLARIEEDEVAIRAAQEAFGFPAALEREIVAGDAERNAFSALLACQPTTPAGLLAVLDAFKDRNLDCLDDDDTHAMLARISTFLSQERGRQDDGPDAIELLWRQRRDACRKYEIEPITPNDDDDGSPVSLLLSQLWDADDRIQDAAPSLTQAAASTLVQLTYSMTSPTDKIADVDRKDVTLDWLAVNTLKALRPYLTGSLAETVADVLDHPDRPLWDGELCPRNRGEPEQMSTLLAAE